MCSYFKLYCSKMYELWHGQVILKKDNFFYNIQIAIRVLLTDVCMYDFKN